MVVVLLLVAAAAVAIVWYEMTCHVSLLVSEI
jgi:hypothetical protein